MNINLDRRSKVSVSTQIEIALRKFIYNHYFSNGQELPSITDLAQELDVKDNDVLNAYRKLKGERIINQVDDKFFVQKVFVPTYMFDQVVSLFDLIKEIKLEPSIETLSVEIIATPKNLKDKIEDQKVIRAGRLYKGNDRPLFYLDIYINIKYESILNILKDNKPYYEALYKLTKLHHSTRSHEAMNAPKDIANILNIPDNSPIVYSSIRSVDNNNEWFEIIESYNVVEAQHFVLEI